MGVFTTTLLLLVPVVAAPRDDVTAELVAAAAASGRPKECVSTTRRGLTKGPTVWQRARQPNLAPYCDLVAKAHASLYSDPESAAKSARAADAKLPGHAAPKVMLARAEHALGQDAEAAKHFEEAKRIDPRSLEHPLTMRDHARVLAKTGSGAEALTVYRALVPRVTLLSSTAARVAVLLEAAHLSMTESTRPAPPLPEGKALEGTAAGATAAGATPSDAPMALTAASSPLDEAIAYLREARRQSVSQLAGDVLLSLALVLDRAGQPAQADALLVEIGRVGAKITADVPDYVTVPEDAIALRAFAATPTDSKQAATLWGEYVAAAGAGPWTAAAKARAQRLGGSSKAKPGKPRKPARGSGP